MEKSIPLYDFPANAHRRLQELSTNVRKVYVHYLSTSELVRCLERVQARLVHRKDELSTRTAELYEGIRDDLAAELASRQLPLFLDELLRD